MGTVKTGKDKLESLQMNLSNKLLHIAGIKE